MTAFVLAFGIASASDTVRESGAGQDADPKALRNPVPSTPDSLAAGAQQYAKVCAVCHGASGNGDGKLAAATAAYGKRPSILTDNVWDHGSTDGEIFVVVRDGIEPDFNMPGFKGRLSDEEMWSVVNYVRSLGAKR
jgi:mono/diheme cytochrome c family protein